MKIKVFDDYVALEYGPAAYRENVENNWRIVSKGGNVDEVWQLGDIVVVNKDAYYTPFTCAGRSFIIIDSSELIGKVVED